MNKLKYIDKYLLFSMVFLAIFGAMMIFSSSSVAAVQKFELSFDHFFNKQIVFILIGLGLFITVAMIPTVVWLRLSKPILYVSIILLVIPFMMEPINNSHSWIRIAGATIQPAEFAKVGMIVYLAAFYNNHKNKLDDFNRFITGMIPVAAMIVSVILQPDLGTAITMVFIVLIVSLSGEIPALTMLKVVAAVLSLILVVGLYVIASPNNAIVSKEQLKRFDFKDPCADYADDGYQVCNGYIAINNGGLLGVGLGESKQKHLYLPEAHNDFIMPIVIEELGFVWGVIVIGVYALVVFRGIYIAALTEDLFGTLLVLGSVAFILAHVLVNLGGVFGIIPMTGVPLPLISSGGSSALAIMLAFGLMQSVAVRNNIKVARLR